MGATYFIVEQIPFPDETASGAPRALVEDAQAAGARRKYLARGEGGFHSQISWFPPGYVVPAHRHDHAELIMVLAGTLEVEGGPTLGAHDSVAIEAGHEYGFAAGADGVTFTTIRQAASGITLA